MLSIASVLVPLQLCAPPVAEPPLEAYRAEVIDFRIEGSWAPRLKLFRGGEEMDPGFFGGDAELVFGTSPGAMEHMETFRTYRITGLALYLTGLSVLVAELVILVVDPELLVDSSQRGDPVRPAFWAMTVGGTVVSVVGGFFIGASNLHLSRAVQTHNEDLYERVREASPGPQTLSWRARF